MTHRFVSAASNSGFCPLPAYYSRRQIRLTADGSIVFRSNADGKSNLWTIGTDGGGRTQITLDAAVDGRGLCSLPDAKQIVFPSRKAGTVNLWRVDIDGGDARQLTFGDGEFFPVCRTNAG